MELVFNAYLGMCVAAMVLGFIGLPTLPRVSLKGSAPAAWSAAAVFAVALVLAVSNIN